jgi:hypothetical protein
MNLQVKDMIADLLHMEKAYQKPIVWWSWNVPIIL